VVLDAFITAADLQHAEGGGDIFSPGISYEGGIFSRHVNPSQIFLSGFFLRDAWRREAHVAGAKRTTFFRAMHR